MSFGEQDSPRPVLAIEGGSLFDRSQATPNSQFPTPKKLVVTTTISFGVGGWEFYDAVQRAAGDVSRAAVKEV
jgi:hypothetical protein